MKKGCNSCLFSFVDYTNSGAGLGCRLDSFRTSGLEIFVERTIVCRFWLGFIKTNGCPELHGYSFPLSAVSTEEDNV